MRGVLCLSGLDGFYGRVCSWMGWFIHRCQTEMFVAAQCLLLGAMLGRIMADTSTGVIAWYAAVG